MSWKTPGFSGCGCGGACGCAGRPDHAAAGCECGESTAVTPPCSSATQCYAAESQQPFGAGAAAIPRSLRSGATSTVIGFNSPFSAVPEGPKFEKPWTLICRSRPLPLPDDDPPPPPGPPLPAPKPPKRKKPSAFAVAGVARPTSRSRPTGSANTGFLPPPELRPGFVRRPSDPEDEAGQRQEAANPSPIPGRNLPSTGSTRQVIGFNSPWTVSAFLKQHMAKIPAGGNLCTLLTCGLDVTTQLTNLMDSVVAYLYGTLKTGGGMGWGVPLTWPGHRRKVAGPDRTFTNAPNLPPDCASIVHKDAGWDILEFAAPKLKNTLFSSLEDHCGTEGCEATVTVKDECWKSHAVNYILWGALARWCNWSREYARGLISTYRHYRQYKSRPSDPLGIEARQYWSDIGWWYKDKGLEGYRPSRPSDRARYERDLRRFVEQASDNDGYPGLCQTCNVEYDGWLVARLMKPDGNFVEIIQTPLYLPWEPRRKTKWPNTVGSRRF